MSERKPKIVKKADAEAEREYLERHERSLLKLLAEKYPREAIRYARKSAQEVIDKQSVFA
jgi:hypothetical protein